MSINSLIELQRQNWDWAQHNFPNATPVEPLLGVVEEVGELSHAFLKKQQGIRGSSEQHNAAMADAVGDIVIYLADFCNRNELSLSGCVIDAWARVLQRDWRKDPVKGGEGSDEASRQQP